MRMTKEARKRISEIFRQMGRKGGLARALKLSPEERTRIGLRAALTRWERIRREGAQAK